ncbi:MAG: DUF2062 domain-containing protein [Francisellaceae bacterium]
MKKPLNDGQPNKSNKSSLSRLWPSREFIQSHKSLRFLANYLHNDYLWHITRSGMTKAALIGFFMCMMPMPFQMVPAAVLAVLFRANMLFAVALVWVSNPFTMLPMMYASYALGCLVLSEPSLFYDTSITFSHFLSHIHSLFLPLLIGSVIIGLAGGLVLACIVWIIFSCFEKYR